MHANNDTRRGFAMRALALGTAAGGLLAAPAAQAANRAEIDAEVASALSSVRALPETANLFRQSRAQLIFPRIISGGFIVGGQYGEGKLLSGATSRGYFNIAGASFGFLAGAQVAGLAMFFMTEAALAALMNADGWEIGTGPSVVIVDRGVQANLTSSTLAEPVYAISFNQQGLMAAFALNGTKITRINPA